MSMFYAPGECEETYHILYEEMRNRGLDERESQLLSRCRVAPRSKLKIMKDMHLTEDEYNAIHHSAREKFFASDEQNLWIRN